MRRCRRPFAVSVALSSSHPWLICVADAGHYTKFPSIPEYGNFSKNRKMTPAAELRTAVERRPYRRPARRAGPTMRGCAPARPPPPTGTTLAVGRNKLRPSRGSGHRQSCGLLPLKLLDDASLRHDRLVAAQVEDVLLLPGEVSYRNHSNVWPILKSRIAGSSPVRSMTKSCVTLQMPTEASFSETSAWT